MLIAVKNIRRSVAPAAIVLLCLGACTSGFLYNRFDTFSYWYLSNLVTLDETQSDALRGSMRDFFAWHRESELPRYAEFAEMLANDSEQPLTRDRIDDARRDLERYWRDVVQRAAPEGARWLASLTPRQRDELFASLAEKDDETREKFCDSDPEKVRKRRERSFISSVESWTGRLDDAQRALIRDGVGRFADSSCVWAENRILFRQTFRQLIDDAAGQPGFESRVTAFLSRPEEGWDPGYRRQFDANRDTAIELLAELDLTLTTAQREKRAKKLRELARDLRSIHNAQAVKKAS